MYVSPKIIKVNEILHVALLTFLLELADQVPQQEDQEVQKRDKDQLGVYTVCIHNAHA